MIVIRGVAAPALAGSIVAVVSRQEEAEIGGDVVRCLRCPTTQKQPPPSYFTNVHYNQCWGTPSPAGVQASGSIPPRGGGGVTRGGGRRGAVTVSLIMFMAREGGRQCLPRGFDPLPHPITLPHPILNAPSHDRPSSFSLLWSERPFPPV